MNNVIELMKNFYGSILLTSLLLTGMLTVFNQEALADYQPPEKKEDQEEKPTSGTISRGCPTLNNKASTQAAIKTGLVALAPQVHHIGKSTITNPTFAWYVSDNDPYPVSLELYQRQPKGKTRSIWTWESTTKPGIMSASFPKDQPPLQVGATYYWQVRIQCDPDSPSSWVVAAADLEVVTTSADLAGKLAQAPDSSTKSYLYADAGIWYDALATALTNSSAGRNDLELLTSLAEVEAQEEGVEKIQDSKELAKTYSYRLRKVIEAEQQKTIFSGSSE